MPICPPCIATVGNAERGYECEIGWRGDRQATSGRRSRGSCGDHRHGDIWAAVHMGLPVSTAHVRSGVDDTMTANHSGLQRDSLRSLLTACVLTPAFPRGSGGVPELIVRTDEVNAGRPLGSTITGRLMLIGRHEGCHMGHSVAAQVSCSSLGPRCPRG